MAIFLILLYILEANGAVIPIGCFVATWVLTIMKSIFGFVSGFNERKGK